MCLHAIRDCAPAHNNNFSREERDLRAELALILARHDSGTLSPAVYAAIKSLETALSWLEHRGRLLIRRRLPARRASETFAVECEGLNYTATVSRYADGRLGEIFIDMIKAGSAADMAARDSAIVCSLALQYGADVETVRRALCRDARGGASGPLGAALDRLRAMEAER